jgi:hypothetical protein
LCPRILIPDVFLLRSCAEQFAKKKVGSCTSTQKLHQAAN